MSSVAALRVGIVRDDRFLLHQPGLVHPEGPGRLKAVYRMLDMDFGHAVMEIQPELATLEQLELVHSPKYIRKVLRTAERQFTYLAPDTTVGSQSYLAAYLAVGGCIKGLQATLAGRCDVCFALVRPPGHHAHPNRAGGFCVFNNIGVTARYAQKRHGLRRILIVDWDIHHGDGVQELFYSEKEVLYFSTHFMGWYPQTGDWEETGAGEGLGYTINVPVPKDIRDPEMVYLYNRILNPVMERYRPELILVSAGFDGHYRDPLGRTQLTELCYRNLTELLVRLLRRGGNTPVLLALEGGYNVGALAHCVSEVLDVLTESRDDKQSPLTETDKSRQLIEKAVSIHKPYGVWTY